MQNGTTEARFEVSPHNFIVVKLRPDIVQADRFYLEVVTDGSMMIEPVGADKIRIRALP